MTDTALDIPAFRAAYPAYESETDYPDAVLEVQYSIGKQYIADSPCLGSDAKRSLIFDMMLAHLLYIRDQRLMGNMSKVISSATEKGVSVSFDSPPTASTFGYWLQTTPYGPDIAALLSVMSVGGFSVGGMPEVSAIRRFGGSLQ